MPPQRARQCLEGKVTYKRVIRGTRGRKQQIAVEKAGHPAAFRKMRCPSCSIGYAVESNTKSGEYVCLRCGASFGAQAF